MFLSFLFEMYFQANMIPFNQTSWAKVCMEAEKLFWILFLDIVVFLTPVITVQKSGVTIQAQFVSSDGSTASSFTLRVYDKSSWCISNNRQLKVNQLNIVTVFQKRHTITFSIQAVGMEHRRPQVPVALPCPSHTLLPFITHSFCKKTASQHS